MPSSKKINLLVKTGFENTTLGRLLAWALSAGRLVVIVTEIIVIGAFISRFWLDRTLTDLGEQNEALQFQVEAMADFEKSFRQVQARLAAYKQWDMARPGAAQTVRQIGQLLPAEVTLTGIHLSGQKVEIEGTTVSEAGLTGLVRALQSSGEFQSVALTDVSLDPTSPVLKFAVEAARAPSPDRAAGGKQWRP